MKVLAGGTVYRRGDEENPGEQIDGVSLCTWDTTGGGAGFPAWVELATSSTASGDVSELTADVSADVLHWWIGGKMYLGLTTKAAQGAGPEPPALTIEYWEVRLQYRLP